MRNKYKVVLSSIKTNLISIGAITIISLESQSFIPDTYNIIFL